LPVLVVGSLAVGSSAWMWQRREGPRYGDQMPVVALRIRATPHPGDLVVTTSMAFANLRYLLDRGVDGGPQATVLPRPSDQDILLAGVAGRGTVRSAVARRPTAPDHVFLLLALGSTGQSYRDYKTELRGAGYCTAPGQVTSYPTTGLLTILVPCR
jgi:hypothetical protein